MLFGIFRGNSETADAGALTFAPLLVDRVRACVIRTYLKITSIAP
jgi:hypothetical protein